MAVGIFGHEGLGLFIKQDPKMAAQGIIRGQNGKELGRFVPRPQKKLPCKTFRVMGTRVPRLLRKQNNEVAVQGIIMRQTGLKLCRIGYWAQQKHFDFWPLRGNIYFLKGSAFASLTSVENSDICQKLFFYFDKFLSKV